MFEKILSLIERAVVALEKLASQPVATDAASAPEAPARKPRASSKPVEPPAQLPTDDDFLGEDPPPAVKYERADVKQALQEYGKKHGMDKAQALFQKVSGVKALSELSVDKFEAVIEATKK